MDGIEGWQNLLSGISLPIGASFPSEPDYRGVSLYHWKNGFYGSKLGAKIIIYWHLSVISVGL